MSARTEQLLQHGSVEAMVEAVLSRQGVNHLEPVGGMLVGGMLVGPFGGFDDPDADLDDEGGA